jgi:hypothetical protein
VWWSTSSEQGTECDGPRIGHSWLNFTAPNPPFVMADGKGGKYTSRVNGLDKYVETCVAIKSCTPIFKTLVLKTCQSLMYLRHAY